MQTPAQALTARLHTQTPSVVSQARPTAGEYPLSLNLDFTLISSSTAQSLRVKSIFYPEEDSDYDQSVEQYQDPLDRLEFPESPSSDDGDYEPADDDDKASDDNEADGDDVNNNNFGESPTRESVGPVTLRKRPRSDSLDSNNDGKYEKARKVVRSSGRPKASDYAQEVQDVLNTGITYYKVDLLRFNPYPDRVDELAWAKAGWSTANMDCDVKIAHNTELIKMVSPLLMEYELQVTDFDILHRSRVVLPICVVRSRRRSNLLLLACMDLRFLSMTPSELATATLFKNSKSVIHFYTRYVVSCFIIFRTLTCNYIDTSRWRSPEFGSLRTQHYPNRHQCLSFQEPSRHWCGVR